MHAVLKKFVEYKMVVVQDLNIAIEAKKKDEVKRKMIEEKKIHNVASPNLEIEILSSK